MNLSEAGDEQEGVRSPVAPPRSVSERRAAAHEDATLVALVREGDAGALEDLYGRYGGSCWSLARRILADEVLAQDVVQEVFLTLWKDAGRYDPARGAFATWLLSLTHHKAVDVVRREENLRKRRLAVEAEEAVAPTTTESPHELAWAAIRRDRVREALTRLPHAQREALGLAYYGGYTQREIAGLTDTPLGTVKTRTLAAMRKLRELLDEVVDDPRPEAGGVA